MRTIEIWRECDATLVPCCHFFVCHTVNSNPNVNSFGPKFGTWPSLDFRVSLVLEPSVNSPSALLGLFQRDEIFRAAILTRSAATCWQLANCNIHGQIQFLWIYGELTFLASAVATLHGLTLTLLPNPWKCCAKEVIITAGSTKVFLSFEVVAAEKAVPIPFHYQVVGGCKPKDSPKCQCNWVPNWVYNLSFEDCECRQWFSEEEGWNWCKLQSYCHLFPHSSRYVIVGGCGLRGSWCSSSGVCKDFEVWGLEGLSRPHTDACWLVMWVMLRGSTG